MPGVTVAPAATTERSPILAPSRTVETVADQRLLADEAVVHHAQVADGGVRADLAAVHADVQDRVVLDVRSLADGDPAEVGADHCAVPDRHVLLDHDVADQHGGRGDPGVRVHGGADALEGVQRHSPNLR